MPSEGPVRRTTKAGLAFPSTSWELVTQASGQAAGAEGALQEFSERYYPAVRAYIAAIVHDPQQHDDLTQRFFMAAVLSRRVLTRATNQKGRFRHYLKEAIRNFLIDEHRRETSGKARAVRPDLHPDAIDGGWERLAGDPQPGADEAFMRAWGRNVVRLALAKTWQTSVARQQQENFELFARRHLGDVTHSWADIGAAYGLDEKTARSRAETAVRHFRTALRELVAADIGAGDHVDDEIRALMGMQ